MTRHRRTKPAPKRTDDSTPQENQPSMGAAPAPDRTPPPPAGYGTVFGVAVAAGVLAFIIGLGASNAYFRLLDIGNTEELGPLFSLERDLGTFSRLIAQYAFCNVLHWLMENEALAYFELTLIPAMSFVFVLLLAMFYMPRSMWNRQFSAKMAVIASTVHAAIVCLLLLYWGTALSSDFNNFRGDWRIFKGELTGWLPTAMGVTLLWNAFLGSVIGGTLGWFLEFFTPKKA